MAPHAVSVWLRPEQFERVVVEAEKLDPELAVLMVVLGYTGMRLGEALGLSWDDVDLTEATAIISEGRTSDPGIVHLPPRVVAALGTRPLGLIRGRAQVFGFLDRPMLRQTAGEAYAAAGVSCGMDTFKVLRHTWAVWTVRAHVDRVVATARPARPRAAGEWGTSQGWG